ncbi:MAG: hypothetical protein G4V63_20150 [Candidatus Afipia apatlaquensis]|uniref:Uncharacterized protein n=1 Tax=Candidatus Afipia apatlaquensis TaxID=2712852 RepID=A0A7C9RHA0_9BRAD|nr:hypothetical protein [Candidatus Afipia apatlaquensis]
MAIAAYRRWRSHEIAMRHERPLVIGWDIVALSMMISGIAIGLGVLLWPV